MEHVLPNYFWRCAATLHDQLHFRRPEKLLDCGRYSLPNPDGFVQCAKPPDLRLSQHHRHQHFLRIARLIGDSYPVQRAAASTDFREAVLLAASVVKSLSRTGHFRLEWPILLTRLE